MKIVQLPRDAAVAAVVEALGFDRTAVDLSAPEVIAAAVRRAASLHCPTTPRRLAAIVRGAEAGLVGCGDDEDVFGVRMMIDNLAAYGDLIEAPLAADGGPEQRVLFLAEPSFVRVGTAVLLLGIRADCVPYLSGNSAELIEYEGHVRRLAAGRDVSADDLVTLGLHEVSHDHWLGNPPFCEASALVAEYDRRLAAAGEAGTIEDCSILDGAAPPTYYRGRWRAVSPKDSGNYVARRPVAYGSSLWCYAHIEKGEVLRLIDLPVRARLNRACDEAWRLQSAIDACAGTPQRVRIERGARSRVAVIHLLSPPPTWAQRRLDAVGRPVPRKRSLLSYALHEDQVEAELDFLQAALWTVRLGDGEEP